MRSRKISGRKTEIKPVSPKRTLFLRFVTPFIDQDSQLESGVFQIAAKLRDGGTLNSHEEEHLHELREWFNRNLERPTKFTNAKPPFYRKRQNAISLFKASAREHISRMREMIAILENHGVHVRTIKTVRPGYVVYEDEFQVVAAPFADSNL